MRRRVYIGFVYFIHSRTSGKGYVGCTRKTVHKRWREHVRHAKQGHRRGLFQRAILKYGEHDFVVEILCRIQGSVEDIHAAEIKVIEERGTFFPGGYNLTRGGDGLDFSDPLIARSHARGVRERTARVEWQEAHAAAMAKLHADPEFCRKREERLREITKTAQWRKNNAASNRAKPQDPKWVAALHEGIRRRDRDPKVRQARSEGAKCRCASPEGRVRNEALLKKARGVIAQRALERDATCSPEERARREKRRASVRRSYAKMKRFRSGMDS